MRPLIKLLSAIFTAGVFVYMIAWLLNLLPENSNIGLNLDGPTTQNPIISAVILNTLLVVTWGAWHSFTARIVFKQWLSQRIGNDMVRSAYVFMSGASLLALCLLWQPFGPTLWHFSATDGFVYWLILTDHFVGWALLSWAILSIKPLAFWGLMPEEKMSLSKVGPYMLARHPIQTGIMISIWACPTMTLSHVLFSALLTAYAIIGALRFEERDLVGEFGAEYKQYQREYWAFLPLGRRRN